jgi:glycine/D-amino acid oxidase-like deaminating enzyme
VLVQHGGEFVPALADAPVIRIRMCARPQSVDGRPFIGPVANAEGLFVCAGHGPWGISTGPGSAALVVELMLGRADRVPAALRADRVPAALRADRPV